MMIRMILNARMVAILCGFGLAFGLALFGLLREQVPIEARNALPIFTKALPVEHETNMIVAMEQSPSTTIIVSQAVVEAPGYVVIQEDKNSIAGAILGSSALLPAGESTAIRVPISRMAIPGEKLHAALRIEKGGDATFDSATDSAVESSFGGPLEGWFYIVKEDDDPSADPIPQHSL